MSAVLGHAQDLQRKHFVIELNQRFQNREAREPKIQCEGKDTEADENL